MKYDLGTRKTAKALETSTDIFNCFKNTNDYSLINEIAQFDKIYGGANGGSNDNKWISNDLLKFGTQSVNGSLTLSLNAYVNAIKITGYVQSNSCKIKVGDSQSLDWSNQSNLDNKTTTLVCSTMTATTKETITNKELSTITVNFEPTNNLKIATINAKPLYISSIELLYVNQ